MEHWIKEPYALEELKCKLEAMDKKDVIDLIIMSIALLRIEYYVAKRRYKKRPKHSDTAELCEKRYLEATKRARHLVEHTFIQMAGADEQ